MNIPIVSANMTDVTGIDLAIALAKEGGLGLLPQFPSIEDRVEMIKQIKKDTVDTKKFTRALLDKNNKPCVAVGVRLSGDYVKEASVFLDAGADVLLLDTARAGSESAYIATKKIKKLFPNSILIVGNIDNPFHIPKLVEAGADCIKIGIGPGSRCKTRVVAGIGTPQIHAVLKCYAVAKELNVPIISDGGIRDSGDFAKALGAGADIVLLGSLFAGTEEAPGDIVIKDGQKFKNYRGSASLEHQQERIKTGSLEFVREPEGESSIVPCTDTVQSVVFKLLNGLRSSMSYVGARDLIAFKNKVKFQWISHSAFDEGKVRF